MKQVKSTAISVFALALALMWLAPLVWLVGTAFSEPTFHMTFLPNSRFTFGNLSYVWNAIPFARYYLNTLILVVVTFCVQFVTSTLAAYALAVMDFKGQTLVFAVIFMQIIIPNDVLITPNFMTLADLGLTDTKVGIMLPFFGSALAIFLLRQHFKSIPKALAEAARIDGANTWQTIWRVYMPCAKPALYVLCGYFRQLPLEQLPVASDCDQLAIQPHADRRPGYLCKVQRGQHAVGQCLRGHLYHYPAAAHRVLLPAEAVYEQLCQRRNQRVIRDMKPVMRGEVL